MLLLVEFFAMLSFVLSFAPLLGFRSGPIKFGSRPSKSVKLSPNRLFEFLSGSECDLFGDCIPYEEDGAGYNSSPSMYFTAL